MVRLKEHGCRCVRKCPSCRSKGKRVARKEVFATENGHSDCSEEEDSEAGDDGGDKDKEDESEDSNDLAGPELGSLGQAGAFSINEDMEAEYEKMMKKSQSELSLLRTPSASEMAKKETEAKQLKHQSSALSALVEFRIHLEGALQIAHRLPSGTALSAACGSKEPSCLKEVEAVAGKSRELLASLLDLQHNLAQRRGVDTTSFDEVLQRPNKRPRLQESDSWAMVDAQMQPLMDWGLSIADEWKERTRLDARRSSRF